MFRTFFKLIAIGLALTAVAACGQGVPKEALQLSPESLQNRQMQTRLFDTTDEVRLLRASAAVLQDFGFNLDESESSLGVIVASKQRDATESGQVAGAVFFAVLFGARLPIDKNQNIRASLVTRPHGSGSRWTAVRITFQRIVLNTDNRVSKAEELGDPQMYREFFAQLSQSVFLEAHEF